MTDSAEAYLERQKRLEKAKNNTEPSDWLQAIGNRQNTVYELLSRHDKEESIHWEKFKSAHLNDQYFKLEHIEDIGLDFDVAFVLTKRGTGKTYNYLRRLAEVARRGEEFVIVRNSKQEIEGGVKAQLEGINSPFAVRNNKVYGRNDDTIQVGYLAYLSGKTQQGQGAGYDKVTTIVWDEATNAGETPKETEKGIRAFWQLTSTFFRNRLDGKVGIFGNLMKDAEGQISNALHGNLGIDSELNFKYIIKRNDDTGNCFKILYLNAGSLYQGAELHMMSNVQLSREVGEDLQSNLPTSKGECILPDYFFTQANKKLFGILCKYDKYDWAILVAQEPYIQLSTPDLVAMYEKGELREADEHFYIIKCIRLQKSLIGHRMDIVSDDANLANLHKDICFFKYNIDSFGYTLGKIIKSGYACYAGDNSFEYISRIMYGKMDNIKRYKERNKVKFGSKQKAKKK